jgi:methionyl-tRNA formyltransferase
MKRYVFIGSVKYSAFCLEALLRMGIDIVDILCPAREVSEFNSDYYDLGRLAKKFNRKVTYFKNIRDVKGLIEKDRPDIIFVLGFSQIIPKDILKIPVIGCIGSHPAELPRNRGRHPIIWAIANGMKKSAITLFWIDEGVDAGDIWAQKRFRIDDSDDAKAVYEKVERLSVGLLRKNIPYLEKGKMRRIRQEAGKATYWRKRTRKDGEIDWRMSSKRIHDLVRALTRPYPGAGCAHKGKEVKIWKTRIIGKGEKFRDAEPGKVLTKNGRRLSVKTGDGVIEILEHSFGSVPKSGSYL